MLSSRDRWLAGLFALQLVAVLAFGVALVHGIGDQHQTVTATQTLLPQGSVPQAGVATVAPSTAAAGTSGKSTTTSTTQGGQAATGAGTTGTASVAKGQPIKIGSIVSQTGAINFVASAQGTKAYIDRVNAAGGVNGHRIDLDLRDDQLDATRGAQQARQLIAEGVFAFAAWNAPQTEGAIVPLLEQNKLPLIGNYGVGDEYHSRWSYPFQSHHFGFEMGRFLAQESSVKHPGVIFTSNSAAKVNAAQVRAFTAGVKAGGKTLSSGDIVQVDVTKVSYDDVVTQFRLGGVDGIATLIDQTAYNRLQQSMDRQGYKPTHVADPLFTDPNVTQSSTTEGTLVASDFAATDSGGAEVQEYATAVRKAYGSSAQISYLGEAGWLDAKILVEALRRMGDDLTRANLLKTMDSLPADIGKGFTAPMHFGPGTNHDLNRCLALTKVTKGKAQPYKGFACDDLSFDR
ncbi:MAG: Extracellular ligand-binding receptor [Frankiales bacterium]|nr:Extracellular ligand-binding receptor [Frankiales bacterium]